MKGEWVVYNQTTLVGRLTRDAEEGVLPNERHTPRLRFTVAVDRDYEVDGETPTDFWPVELLGEYAPRLAPHLTKGRLVLVSGAAHIDQRRDDGGAVRVFPYLSARLVRFLDRRPERSPVAGEAM
jgi:single-strand DNA-binding protein